MTQAESFLRRWSRLKLHSTETALIPSQSPIPETVAPEASEFGAFLDPNVSRDARQAALRTLFMTDHYRAMDGLDVYVGDYSKPELLASEVLDKLEHARDLLNRESESGENESEGKEFKIKELKDEPAVPSRSLNAEVRND